MKIKRVAKGKRVDRAYDRMVEIAALIQPTSSKEAVIEYSALLCMAASVVAAHRGIEPTSENQSRILALIVEKIVPALEAEFDI
jgi:hypothetical protein